jgi:NAD(P)-dependent dehydrogenase (short-subunit alcohol dehydrogenase family)
LPPLCPREGARLVVLDIREEAATAAAGTWGRRAKRLAVAATVADDASVKAMVEKALSSGGKLIFSLIMPVLHGMRF